MRVYFINESDFPSFVGSMLKATTVFGPVAKKSKFVFKALESYEELRLDYDITILPAKKVIFPTKQPMVTFDCTKIKSALQPAPRVLFGVHFYEIKAIDMLDELFRAGYSDRIYLANREATTIVGSNIQRISPRAFWASVGIEVKPTGHDAFLTKIKGGYTYEVLSEKGDKLLAFGSFVPASEAQITEAVYVNEAVLKECKEKLTHSTNEIAEKVRASFTDKAKWEEFAHDCFSCGTCNIVCPTCYCFDVQDTWNLDQVSGVRCRSWDGCLLEDFSKVTLSSGASENFREERWQRFRHRIMRKATYLNEKLGGPACVGCGRCSVGCVPDIADPVHIIEKIMEG